MRTEVSHFWVGSFKSESDFFSFFGETPDYYLDEREIEEKYISEFAKTQNINWFDRDFFECGFEKENNIPDVMFSKYSYSQFWLDEIKRRMEQSKLGFEINSIAFIAKDAIKNPESIKNEKYELIYLGTVEYPI